MFVTVDELRTTESILTKYFKDIKVLNIWKASVYSRREYKERLEERINKSEILVQFTDNVKSLILSLTSPA